jgi:hypothetical protein
MILLRILLAAFAIVMIAFGVVAMIAPTPFGFVFVILGFLLLAAAAPAFIGKLRGHWPWLDRRLDAPSRQDFRHRLRAPYRNPDTTGTPNTPAAARPLKKW